VRQASDKGTAQPQRRDPPEVGALTVGGLRGLATASLPTPPTLRLGRRPHVGGMMRSFPPVAQRHAPPMFGCCSGARAVEGLQAWVGCAGASLHSRCSARPTQTAGGGGDAGAHDDGLLDLTGAPPTMLRAFSLELRRGCIDSGDD
jgi:hypothetical protein